MSWPAASGRLTTTSSPNCPSRIAARSAAHSCSSGLPAATHGSGALAEVADVSPMPGGIRPEGPPEDRQPVMIAALRTPLCRAHGALKTLHAHELLAPVLRRLLTDTGVPADQVSDVVIGNAVGGGGDVYLAGGVESISTAPLRARPGPGGDPQFFSRARFAPAALGDPDMGVAAENVAVRFGISRQRQDDFALRSHRRALGAAAAGAFEREVVALPGPDGPAGADDGPRRSLTPAVLARFPAAFVPDGTVTAGNSCFDADGAAAVVVTSLARAKALGASDGLVLLGTDTAGVEPALLGMGAASAAERLLAAKGFTAADLSLIEFNEAFASQVLACLDHLGVDPQRANLDGGALALGHAYGASGAVLVTRLLAQARRDAADRSLALAMISIAGGMGTAALFEYRSFL